MSRELAKGAVSRWIQGLFVTKDPTSGSSLLGLTVGWAFRANEAVRATVMVRTNDDACDVVLLATCRNLAPRLEVSWVS